MSDNRKMADNMIWNALGNIVYLGCQWLMTISVTRLMGFEEAGILSLAMSISASFQTVALFGIRNYQVSDLDGKYSDSNYVATRLATCGAAMAMCIVFSAANRYSAVKLAAIFLFMLFRLSENFSDVLHGIAQNKDRLDIAGKAFLIKGTVTIVCFFAGYFIFRDLTGALLVMAVSSCCTTFFYDLNQVKELSSFSMNRLSDISGALIKETMPLCVYQFLISAIATTPKYFLERMSSEEALGAYSSIFAPALLVQAAAGYIYTPFAARLTEHIRGGRKKDFVGLALKISGAVMAIGVVTLTAARLFGEPVLVLIFGERIREYVYLLIPIIVSIFFSTFLTYICMLEVIVRDFRGIIAACLAGFAVCAAASPLMINAAGISGTSFGYIAGLAVSIAIALISMARSLKKAQC